MRRLETDFAFTGGFPPMLVGAYRGRIQVLRAAPREDAVRPLRSFELAPNGRHGQHTLRVTEGWKLVVSFEDGKTQRATVVHAIVEQPESVR